jgi:3-oxoacyl-[acyl-carrier-protein] synthase-3
MNIGIRAIATHVPERIVSNDELSQTVDTSDEWIRSHTGIESRRISDEKTFASDLAIEAGQKALDQAGLSAEDIDLIIVATSSPDYTPFPATASIVQHQLGCVNAGAFDLQAGCSGFVYAIETARGMITAGSMDRILVIGAEVLTKITNWKDRNTCVLFGDGAGAAIIERSSEALHIIEDSWLRSKGSGANALMRETGGTRVPFDAEKSTEEDFTIKMNGKKVYLFAVDAIVQTITRLCERAGIAPEDLDWIVPHQANSRIIEAAAQRLNLSIDRFFMNLQQFANTSAASIPIAIQEMVDRNLIRPGQRMLTIGFGAGLTYGGNLIRW